MLPIIELRGAIPIGITVYHTSALVAFFWAVLGSIIPVAFIIWGLDLLINKLLIRRIHIFNRFFTWLFEKTKKHHSKQFKRWRDLALVIWSAIPLPGFGAWTGALLAFVFGVPLKRALPLISLGIVIAGIFITLITLGIISLPFI